MPRKFLTGIDVTGTTTMRGPDINVPVTLTDAATIATDASTGTWFRVTLAGNRTLGNPTNPTDGQMVVWELIQEHVGLEPSMEVNPVEAVALGAAVQAAIVDGEEVSTMLRCHPPPDASTCSVRLSHAPAVSSRYSTR